MNTKQLIIGLLIFAAVVAVFIWLYNRNAKATATANGTTTTAAITERALRAKYDCACGKRNASGVIEWTTQPCPCAADMVGGKIVR